MNGGRREAEPRAPLDARRGRTAPASELRELLSGAPAAYLEGAADNPSLGEDEMVLLLRNRAAAPALLARIARDTRWTRRHEVKRLLVAHPRTPLPLARSLAPHLYWRDLAETAEDVRVSPAVRRQAEEILTLRLQEMALGERIALAHRASRGVIAALRELKDGEVIRALLGNSRLLESDAIRIASRDDAPRDALATLAEHPLWSTRHAVRMAVVLNPRTPVRAALGLVRRMSRHDLSRLARDPRAPRIVRVGAARRLETASDRAGGPSAG